MTRRGRTATARLFLANGLQPGIRQCGNSLLFGCILLHLLGQGILHFFPTPGIGIQNIRGGDGVPVGEKACGVDCNPGKDRDGDRHAKAEAKELSGPRP